MSYEALMEIASYGIHFIRRTVLLLLLLTLLSQIADAITYYNSSGVLYMNPDPGSNSKSWPDAQSYCRSLSATLGILDTSNKRQSFIEALSNFSLYSDDVWLGANANYGGANGWRWLSGANYTGPAIQGPSDFINSFIIISKPETSISVKAASGIYVYNYLCQYPSSSSACGGGPLFASNGYCYFLSNTMTTWFTARTNCLANGGELAIFQDFNSISPYLTVIPFWIGLRSSSWSWQNTETGTSHDVTYSFWAYSQPNDDTADCMSMRNGAASDNTCNVTLRFICQRGVTSSAASSSTVPYPRASSSSRTTARTSAIRASTTMTYFSKLPRSPNDSSPILSTNETSSEDPSHSTKASTQISLAMVIGIAVGIGVPAIVVIILVIVVVVTRRRKNDRKAEEQNPRDQSVSHPENSQTAPPYMVLQRDRPAESQYAPIVNINDYIEVLDDSRETSNTRNQNVSPQESSQTVPGYMTLQNMTNRANENPYAPIVYTHDYLELHDDPGAYRNLSELALYDNRSHIG